MNSEEEQLTIENNTIDRSTAVTVLEEIQPETSEPSAYSKDVLVENYQAIIKDRCIQHPVHYQFIRELGKGRQGIVFLVLRHGGRTCQTRHAIKLHDPSIYSNSETYWTDMTRLASQISKLQPVQCDSLVTRETYDEYKGVGFIQMAAIDGVDLQYFLEGTHLGIARSQSTDEEWHHFMSTLFRLEEGRVMLQPGVALYILRKMLLGLQVMHDCGYLHGDIKPSNVMIDHMGSIKLVDFGRAVIVGEQINILLGSPLYMAPETHRLEPGLPQADIYGAGLVGIEMLGGQPLAECAKYPENKLLDFKMNLINHIDAVLPAHVRENRFLTNVLKRFIQPDPLCRFASAKEAEESYSGLRGVHRNMGLISTDAEYDRELQHYLEKIADPDTGRVNPRLD